MRYPTSALDEQLKSRRKTIEEALGKLKNPTQEIAEKTVRDLLPSLPSDAKALVPFTGYYGTNTAADAFFSIDTTEVYINFPLTKRITIRPATRPLRSMCLMGKPFLPILLMAAHRLTERR